MINDTQKDNNLVAYCYRIKRSLLELNEGQKEGLPKNPRFIRDEKYEQLKLSIQRSPEFLEANPLKIYPLENGHYIIIDGNMRCLVGDEIGLEEYPCYIFKKDTPNEKLMEYAVKANTAYGNWNWELLAEEWNTQQLTEWGVDLPIVPENINLDDFFDEESEKQKDDGEKVTVSIPKELAEQKSEITEAIKEALKDYDGIKVK